MAKGLSVTIKTPHSTIKPKDMAKVGDLFFEEIEKRAITATIGALSESVKIAYNRSIVIAATFFQRVCARTPLDEDYLIGITEDGKELWHKANKTQCRMDWYAECNGKQLYARDIAEEFPEIFDKYNNSNSINLIRDMMKNTFEVSDKIEITFGNENPYFATLEYGGYKKDSEAKIGVDKGLEHGVKNKHSIQAPVGMLRITQMEFEDIVRRSMSSENGAEKISSNFRRQRTSQNLSEADLYKLVKKYKASRRLPLSDIKRFIEL